MRLSVSNVVSFMFLAAVSLALFLSGAGLNLLGLNYSGNEGAGGLKVHPYVWFTVGAVLVLVLRRTAGPSAWSCRSFRTPIACSVFTIAVLILKAIVTGAQALGFAVDTILAMFWIAAVAPFMNQRTGRRTLRLGLAFVILESAMAIFEVVTQTQFIPIDTWYGSYFRATALHGHPLNNALILVTVAVALQLSGKSAISILVFVLTTAALSAFGARGALMVYLTLNALMSIRFGLRSVGRMALVSLGAPFAIGLVGWMLASGMLGDRIANVGAYDSSSGVRLQSVEILNYLDWRSVLAGTDPDAVSRMMDRADIGVIENFLVAYVLMFGLGCTLLLLACIWICLRRIAHDRDARTRRRLSVMFVAFFMTAMTNNSLATKTPALYLCAVFAWAAGREMDRRRQKPPRAREAFEGGLPASSTEDVRDR
ncbi:VpsF family polysaccharide biosynthesis protein [Caballeronia sp. LZ008]|uniref:VpsF family polysaccharide biosynthesis protein n=1 Tax=unclassified Caballeronia TaxID=2646786 RepID=UPI0028557C98|nr:VpsF family polysaccharide biosynthesis protein [Caballeronia sp. LZ008]MDR5794289.1 VpsF family polysaccharide biosynthesis protein [Caballeronia sp. LZ008]